VEDHRAAVEPSVGDVQVLSALCCSQKTIAPYIKRKLLCAPCFLPEVVFVVSRRCRLAGTGEFWHSASRVGLSFQQMSLTH
jgi:hypothetical protein